MEYEYKNKEVNLAQLIAEAGVGDFGRKIKGTEMWFIFVNPINASDKTKLDNAVENHVAQPLPPTPDPIMDKLNEILNKVNSISP